MDVKIRFDEAHWVVIKTSLVQVWNGTGLLRNFDEHGQHGRKPVPQLRHLRDRGPGLVSRRSRFSALLRTVRCMDLMPFAMFKASVFIC